MPRDEDEENSEVGEEEETEPKQPEYNYDEIDEETGFKKVDKMIWDLYMEARTSHLKEKESEDAENKEEPMEDDFDKDGFIASMVESKHLNDNRVKMVLRLGLYKGEVNEFNERHGEGHAIYSNQDQYKGGFQQNLKHGNRGLYIYYSQHPTAKTLLNEDLEIMKMKETDEVKKILSQEDKSDDEKLKEASSLISSKDPFSRYLPHRVFYVLKYGPYPFYEGPFCNDKKTTSMDAKYLVDQAFEPPNFVVDPEAVIKYKDGSIYIGQFLDSKKHGFGTMYYSNGDVYRGEWKNNLKHGVGDYYFASNKSSYHQSTWENGQIKSGQWRMPCGTVYQSNNLSKQSPFNSTGTFIFDSTTFKGEKKKIQVHGTFIEDEWQPKSVVLAQEH
ncbi:hypothetical protein C9374_005274 [Naegleria lovaniensis]|uniref:Uncharacterized protein n=1 Tax=Naegleria lovaniensis TaxID=51637 RepID=A0AA88GKN7_NAELO|nr:uncharacterized protein C9374_005274 [Naegleria lovaniensis]KAG2382694.1 hypothetical protein C9374_005274 [Naegleria lovaniensis]